jgi:valyl-tRNA synthetase
MHLSDISKEDLASFDYDSLEEMDKWILSKAQEMIRTATDSFEVYEFSKAKAAGENFFWHDLCDNYLEICKDRLYNPDKYENGKDKRKSAQVALYHSLLSVLKVLAPFASFITDEAYHMKFSEVEGKKSIHISEWPRYNKSQHDEMAIVAGDIVVDAIAVVRKAKSEKQKSMNAPVSRIVVHCEKKAHDAIESAIVDFKATIKAEEVVFSEHEDGNPEIKVELEFKEI